MRTKETAILLVRIAILIIRVVGLSVSAVAQKYSDGRQEASLRMDENTTVYLTLNNTSKN